MLGINFSSGKAGVNGKSERGQAARRATFVMHLLIASVAFPSSLLKKGLAGGG